MTRVYLVINQTNRVMAICATPGIADAIVIQFDYTKKTYDFQYGVTGGIPYIGMEVNS